MPRPHRDVEVSPDLPIAARRDDIAAALQASQVVVVAGETGSGKTTQLPKICMQVGRGAERMIGHTQPRRLAARTVAARIAEELDTPVGGVVGYAVRFTDRVGPDTSVKVMTDGILLAEIHRDRRLRAYDTLIIDEAHERSLNIDFLLGYLVQLLPRRPDLKVVVTSATIETERFSRHFGGAPVIEVSGRAHPVEVRYRPLDRGPRGEPLDVARDQVQGIVDAVAELRGEVHGDVLVFLSGEREIRDTAAALRALALPATDVLPLYARLSTTEQQRVFAPHAGRRIVLATNVAETSITVPGIRAVVDAGTARISRYSTRLKVQRLPIEAISQASAAQRAGRCGRVAPGVCIRLYSEVDLAARTPFTEPEILRTNLAAVILQMAALRLGDVASFPFLDPPDHRAIADGMRLLEELGALQRPDARQGERAGAADAAGAGGAGARGERGGAAGATGAAGGTAPRLTRLGRSLARLPVDPRLGRMVLEADARGCLREVLILAAALSIEDPRVRPADQAEAADAAHRRFADRSSDFVTVLNLWAHVTERQRELSANQFRRQCRLEHLHHLRIREWQDLHAQLRQVAAGLGLHPSRAQAHPDDVHRAVLAGLLSHVGQRDGATREYRGARGARFAIFPGSALARRPPDWVMAAELVETSRLWGRTVARIRPEWAEPLAAHLVTRSYGEPVWSSARGTAVVGETVRLYGLPIVAGRMIPYSRVDRAHARELFVRHALVDGDWRSPHGFVAENRLRLAELAELEHRFRRGDLVPDADTLARLYDARIGADVTSGPEFDAWWKRARRRQPDLLTFTRHDLLDGTGLHLDEAAFPETWRQGDLCLRLSYLYDPGNPVDGVTVRVPLAALPRLRPEGFDWQVPGLRQELALELARTLPKTLRRHLAPITATVADALATVDSADGTFAAALAAGLRRVSGQPVTSADLRPGLVPEHLRMTFAVHDEQGSILAASKDLLELQAELAPRARDAVARAAAGIERQGLRTWSVGSLPRRIQPEPGAAAVGYPALVDEGATVGVRVFADPESQAEAMWAGTRRLLRRHVAISAGGLRSRLQRAAGLALTANPYPDLDALGEDCVVAALDHLMAEHGGPAWEAAGFDRLKVAVLAGLEEELVAVVDGVAAVLAGAVEVDAGLDDLVRRAPGPLVLAAIEDVAAQRGSLVHAGVVASTGASRLAHVARYLRAAAVRLAALAGDPARDHRRMAQVRRVARAYGEAVDALEGRGAEAELERIGWMIEELRVSLFAQQLGTPEPVSETRILRAIARLGPEMERG
ncbi:MAG: ATP-dependent RNA helicase HrpA [Actinobacteria bacterium]|nr:ATP-dependent RNA helicase HrpA [Actinomycetota bacterium]